MVAGMVKTNIDRFLKEIILENINFKQLGLPFDMDEAIGYLRSIYL